MAGVEPNPIKALSECCAYKAPSIILNTETGTAYHGRLISIGEASIELEVWEQIRPSLKSSRLCVSFVYRGNSCAFFSTVLEFRPASPPQPPILVLEVPKMIVGMESRAAQRFTVGKKSGLSLRVVTKDGRSWVPKPINLSLTGILVEFQARKVPDLSVGSNVDVVLRLGGDEADLKGEVRRRVGNRYGLFFREVFTKRGMTPPEPLRRIIETLAPSVGPGRGPKAK